MSEKTETKDPRHVLTLPMRPTRVQKARLGRIFRAANNLKNALIAKMLRAYKEMTRTSRWKRCIKSMTEAEDAKAAASKRIQSLRARQKRMKKKNRDLPPAERAELKTLEEAAAGYRTVISEALCERRQMWDEYGFSEYGFHKKLTRMRQHFRSLIPSNVSQKIGSAVWAKFSSLLKDGKGTAKHVSFSAINDLVSIETKTTGDFIFNKEEMTLRVAGMVIEVARSRKDPHGYEEAALQSELCYCRIIRKPYPEGWRYMLQLVLKGRPPRKACQQLGSGAVGNDIGPQTIAAVSGTKVTFAKLADGAQKLQNEIRRVDAAMERSRRATNPGMFDAEGQIIPVNKLPPELVCLSHGKMRRRWIKSKRYRKLEQLRRSLFRQQRELRITRHRELINKLIQLGNRFFIEEMNWPALAKRAKETKRRKDGRYASKKRFGKSIASRAPGLFVKLYREKVVALGGTFEEIITREARASQYDHTDGTYTKKKLSERYAHLSDGSVVQRDLYSAFLIRHVNQDLKTYNQQQLEEDFDSFKKLQDREMIRLRSLETKLPSSMGLSA